MLGEEGAGCQLANERLVDRRPVKAEVVDVLGQRQLGDGHLVFDGSGLLLADLGGQQVADDLLGFVLALDGGSDDLIVGSSHAVELQLSHRVDDVGPLHLSFSSSCHIGRSRQWAHRPASAHPAS